MSAVRSSTMTVSCQLKEVILSVNGIVRTEEPGVYDACEVRDMNQRENSHVWGESCRQEPRIREKEREVSIYAVMAAQMATITRPVTMAPLDPAATRL